MRFRVPTQDTLNLIAGLALVSYLAVGVPANGEEPNRADQHQSESSDTEGAGSSTQDPSVIRSVNGAPSASSGSFLGRIVFRDPATGENRSMTPEELREFLLMAQARGEDGRGSDVPYETVLENGTVIVHQGNSHRFWLFSTVESGRKAKLSHSAEDLIEAASRTPVRAEEASDVQ